MLSTSLSHLKNSKPRNTRPVRNRTNNSARSFVDKGSGSNTTVQLIDSRTAPATQQLPDANHFVDKLIIIKDQYGTSGSNAITITCLPGQTIDGQAFYILSSEYESVTLYSGSGQYFIM